MKWTKERISKYLDIWANGFEDVDEKIPPFDYRIEEINLLGKSYYIAYCVRDGKQIQKYLFSKESNLFCSGLNIEAKNGFIICENTFFIDVLDKDLNTIRQGCHYVFSTHDGLLIVEKLREKEKIHDGFMFQGKYTYELLNNKEK